MSGSSSLLGKLAFVTGAGSGIGRSTCQVLAREGAKVIAADRNLKAAQETIEALPKQSTSDHLSLDLNVGDSQSVKTALSKAIEKYRQPPTVLVNCAGVTRDNFLIKLSEEDFDEVINVNLKGTFLMVQKFAAALIEREIKGASVINIGSIVGKFGNIGQSNYTASKAGVVLLTKTASKEFGKFGIRCNVVLPGFIVTPMTETIPEKVKKIILSTIPVARFGETKEVAEVIAFLASDKSSFVNGAAIEVTGGQ